MTPEQAYQNLLERMKEIALLGNTAGVLGWDQEVYMPSAAAPYRAEQLSLLAGMTHRKFTDPAVGEWLSVAEGSALAKDPFSDSAVNLREWRHSYGRSTKLPQKLVEEMARVTSNAQVEWVEARKESKFERFRPWLEKILALVKEQAECYGYQEHPYDALLEDYEPGLTKAKLDRLFPPLKERLAILVRRIGEAKKKPDVSILKRKCAVPAQQAFCRELALAVGFDFGKGRIDVSAHPFTTGLGPADTRITTRFEEDNFENAFFSTLHEAGHGLYDQNLPSAMELYGTPRASAVSLGIHESQSRLWENLVGRSLPFWKHFHPKLQAAFPGVFDDVSLPAFVHAINHSAPSFIRTESDEVTYNLHVALRFDLETAMVSGDLKPADVPAAWNEAMRKNLGVTPPDDARGCLQDVHWSHGSFGYFPTYTLGNLYSAQFFAAAEKTAGPLAPKFEKGDFTFLQTWLKEKIHSQGQKYRADKLCREATGSDLSAEHFLGYLERKFGELYQL